VNKSFLLVCSNKYIALGLISKAARLKKA